MRKIARMKRTLVFLLMAMPLATLTIPAQAVSFLSYGTYIPFQNALHESTGRVYDDMGRQGANLWVGTIEDSRLGTAYLCSETDANGGLHFMGNAGYLSYNGRLPLQASPACTLPAGDWSVLFVNGVPYLNCDGSWVPRVTVSITNGTFSIPVKDQDGNPVVGAVFEIEGITWGGNDYESFGRVRTGSDGVLRFPNELLADRSYWFTQVSAPDGCEKMTASHYDVEIAPTGGFRAMSENAVENIAYVDTVINRCIKAPVSQTDPSASPQPPKTGDSAQPLWWVVMMAASVLCIGWLALHRHTYHRGY